MLVGSCEWDDTYLRDTVGITFMEVNSVQARLSVASSLQMAVLWYTDSLKPKTALEGHSSLITDMCFSPTSSRLATSSFDKTVRIWDADINRGFSLHTFMGHSVSVMSLDIHPNRDDLICSCDGEGEIRYWNIHNGSCIRVFKGGTAHLRFQPRHGRFLAAAATKIVSILDTETQGHANPIQYVCWDTSGEYLASVSVDSVRVWSLTEGVCVRDLSSNGNKFY
ncbi:hypothetical protein L1987_67750 [Smallanthus sonchifolius]|uniref:Uncharacterized protein n=1 Tax=Smallanthus sonchifolius TaxID=185202 RepID=A0ACB9B7N7_9ASTR|nr:hypothetical protein L1987_67750 [Smallanthus sonchifolius]